MNKLFHTVILLTLSVLMPASPAFAQDEEPTLPSAEETGETVPEEGVSASQEVEITEDNYRQFMELKDPMRQRDVIPENVFKPGSGLQKLEKLPEESQKHLRNQLREIIVKGDPWQPGDEETEYAYTPSAAASTNPALEKQELEAWGELVDSYHDRESRIYENSSGAQAARGSEQGSSNNQQNGAGQPGSDSQNSEGSQGQTPGQEGNPDQAASEGTFSVNGSGDPNASNTAGVSQNAMEFLQGLGNGGNSETQAGNPATEGTADQGEASTQSVTEAGQQGSAEQGVTTTPASNPNATSTAGSAQNAMEFLRGNTGQGGTASEGAAASSGGQQGRGEKQADRQGQNQSEGQQSDQAEGQEAAAGAAQNALEYLTGEGEQAGEGTDSEADVAQPAGTLTIEDLLNARGVGDSSGMDPTPVDPDEEQRPDENISDKDGDG